MNEQNKSLIRAYVDGVITPDQFGQLQRALLTDSSVREQFLHEINVHNALEDVALGEIAPIIGGDLSERRDSVDRPAAVLRGRNMARWSFALTATAVAVVALFAILYFSQPTDEPKVAAEPKVATVTGLYGPIQFTGNGGSVLHDLAVGSELSGGTVDGMSPESWLELDFNDGSTVTISGTSMLTFSDPGQKELHLKSGRISASVETQPVAKPMLIHTPTAMLTVVGTTFEVEAGPAATALNVSEGEVRVKRLSDGRSIDVPANHRAIAAADRELSREKVPDSVDHWKSQLRLGPEGTYGKWSPATAATDATLQAIPYSLRPGVLVYIASIPVSRGDKPPVVLQPGSRFRVRGRIASPQTVYFGVTVRHSNGVFAGRFLTTRPAVEFPSGQDFEVVLNLEDFRLDPTLVELKSRLPSVPFHLVVESMWCHTWRESAGLEIIETQLVPPTTSATEQPTETEPPQPPELDVWTAASQGNLAAVRRRLAGGAEIDAAFIAPGVPASGATPLHLAVLCDQREIAEFLINQGANLDVRAKDEHGGTPLHWAAVLGRIAIARRLIEAGADVNSKDNHGFTPLDATNYDRESEKEAKLEIARLLQQKGAKTTN